MAGRRDEGGNKHHAKEAVVTAAIAKAAVLAVGTESSCMTVADQAVDGGCLNV